MELNSIMDRVKKLVKKGNVSRILVKRGDQQILNLPVNVGLVGAAVGLTSAKWLMLAGVIAAVGFKCTVEVVKSDGSIISLMNEESNKKVIDFASEAVEKVKDTIPVSINVVPKTDLENEPVDPDGKAEQDENK